jgi:hypothetical protein
VLGILVVTAGSAAAADDGNVLYAELSPPEDRPGLPEGVASLDEAMTVRMAAMQDAAADVPKPAPSPFVAGLMSGIIPGSGQLAMNQKRGWIYLGIEVAAWFSFFAFRSAADQGESDARAFADDHWTFQQYEAREPCGEGLGPIDFDQERADLIEAYESDLDTYYDEIGRNDVYACGWDEQGNRSQYVQQQDAAVGRRLGHLGHHGIRYGFAGKLASRHDPDLQHSSVVRAELLDQQRDAIGASGENRTTRCFGDSRLGHVCLANLVVERRRIACLIVVQKLLGGIDAAFSHRRSNGAGRSGQRCAQRLDCRIVADFSESHGRRRGDFLIIFLEQTGQPGHGRRVATEGDRIDHADQRSAFERSHRLPQHFIGFRTGDGFQGDPGPGDQLLVVEQRGQRGHGLLGAEYGQLLAGDCLVGLRRIGRFEYGDQVLFPGVVGIVGRPDRHGRQHRRAQRDAAYEMSKRTWKTSAQLT